MTAPNPTRILVVDDEEIVLLALKETLRHEQYEVIATNDANVALTELKQRSFAAVITDQRMPRLSGLELLAQARRIQPDATRVLITAVLNLDTVIEAINQGEIYRFVVKPWLREELLITIRNAVQRHELITQNAQLQSSARTMNEQLVELNRALEQQTKRVEQQNQLVADLERQSEQNLGHSTDLSLHTLEMFHPTLGIQARRAAQLCRAMADAANLSADDRRTLECAALLHDLGMVGVPRQIIRWWEENPNSIGAIERSLLERHPVLGQKLTAHVRGMETAGEIIRAHHERFDGTGYPDKLGGDKIPWLARLLAVAAAWASNRRPREDTVAEIRRQSGWAFDPEAVRAFLKALPAAEQSRKEREVMLTDLRPGMVLARGIYAASGSLLLSEGEQLNEIWIEKIYQQNRIQPITQSLVVYC